MHCEGVLGSPFITIWCHCLRMGRTLPDFQCIVQALNFEIPCTSCSIYILLVSEGLD
jgi:hypothetical protein